MKLALLFKFQIIVCTSLLTYMDATLIFIFFFFLGKAYWPQLALFFLYYFSSL